MSDQLTAPIENTETQTTETPAATPPADNKLGNDPTGLRGTIQKAVAESKAKDVEREKLKTSKLEIEAVRGPDGKFQPKDNKPVADSAAPKNDKAAQAAPTDAVEPKKPDAAPGTWKPEARAKWDALDPGVKAEVLRRESEATREIAKFQNELKAVRDGYADIDTVLGPRKGPLVANYGSVGKALNEMFRLSDWAGQDPDGFTRWLYQQTGRNAPTFAEGQAADQAPHPLMQKVQGLETQLQTVLGEQQQRQIQSLNAEIQSWIGEKDQSGAPLRPHYEAVREQLFGLLPSIKTMFPTESPKQHMERGYQAAIQLNPEIAEQVRSDLQSKAREQLEAQERAKRAQLANKSINGTAPTGEGGSGPKDANDLRATLRAKYRASMNGDARI